jgi:hypothetical protein
LYVLSVEGKEWAGRAADSLSAVRRAIPAGSAEAVTAEAYQGALEVVRAKHSRWPPNKLKHLNRGAEILDALVEREPANLEARYLRLASYIFLPFFLRRDEKVTADLEALVQGLPGDPEAFSPPVYRAVVRFVLENGKLGAEERATLQAALDAQPVPTLQTDTPTNERLKSDG